MSPLRTYLLHATSLIPAPTRAGSLALALLGLAACTERPSDTGQVTADETGTTAADTTAPTTGSDGPGSSSSTTDGPGSSSGDGSTSSTVAELEDPCLGLDPCPPECVQLTAYPQREDLCDLDMGSRELLCVSPGEPLAPEPTTYYAMIGGEMRYAVVDQPCTDNPLATPIGWKECSGAPGEPLPCSCLCSSQGCPSKAELMTLEACGLPEPCGEAPFYNESEFATDYDLCVLAALRDRIPGQYASVRSGFMSSTSHVFLASGESAQLLDLQGHDLCFSVLADWYEPTRTCTLRPPAWFDACIAEPKQQPDCLFGESWFDGCVELPASCP